ncbi:MAG: kynureninase [Chloroflexota bacterium]
MHPPAPPGNPGALPPIPPGLLGEEHALNLDAVDPLAPFRARFYTPPGAAIYLDGNSLGLLSRDAEVEILRALDEWKRLGVEGWLGATPPWYYLDDRLAAALAPLVGAEPDEVAVTGSTTINLHHLVATFFQPAGARRRIVATALDFPSDIYALRGQIALRGGDPARDLLLVESRDGRTVEEDDIAAALARPDVALALLPSVLYRSGQLLDLARLAAVARAHGVLLGFDCSHSVGAVPHAFDAWGVDVAVWCTYKYLNGGPGATAALYVNRRHHGHPPALPGWWGSAKERQFDMAPAFDPAAGAAAWRISTPPVLGTAALLGTLRLHHEAGIARVRAASLARTTYLMALLEEGGLTRPPYNFAIGTPRDDARRGGHVALEHPDAVRLGKALKARGIVPDYRPPNVIRLAPVPLYTSYHDLWQTMEHLRSIVDRGETGHYPAGREVVA